jgi:hypothetical protein
MLSTVLPAGVSAMDEDAVLDDTVDPWTVIEVTIASVATGVTVIDVMPLTTLTVYAAVEDEKLKVPELKERANNVASI